MDLFYSNERILGENDVPKIKAGDNMLINWYFKNPINQRNKNVYNEYGYTIDGFLIESGSLEIVKEGIKISRDSICIQKMEEEIYQSLLGKKVTASVLTADGDLRSVTMTFLQDGDDVVINGNGYTIGMHSFRPHERQMFRLGVYDREVVLEAAKVELGDQQTLAHREGDKWVLNDSPPNKSLELLKCQRYQYEVVSDYNREFGIAGIGIYYNDGYIHSIVPLPTTMRAVPTISFKGNWRAVRTDGGIEGFAIREIKIDRVNNGSIALNVSIIGEATPGEVFNIWYVSHSDNSMFFDANL